MRPATRRIFAVFVAVVLVVGAVPWGVVEHGGPDLSPVGVVSAATTSSPTIVFE